MTLEAADLVECAINSHETSKAVSGVPVPETPVPAVKPSSLAYRSRSGNQLHRF